MSYNSSVYNQDYYKSHCGDCYERGHGWEEIFARQAERIVNELSPKTVLDVGCAVGYLVEGLRDRGVDARGIDVSEYAISQVRDDIKSYCTIQSATTKIEGKYDLITCIEVMEHLAPEDFTDAIKNMCEAADTIIFSSTPFDYNEESHYSVNPPSFWAEKFAYNGFYHDVAYDCSYIAVQTMLFRKLPKTSVDLVREYEDKLFALWRENCMLRDNVNLSNARINDLDRGNIEHAHEIANLNSSHAQELAALTENYNHNITELNDSVQQLQLSLADKEKKYQNSLSLYETQKNEELNSIEQKYRRIVQAEYEKRDVLENKYYINANRTSFLESELSRYMSLTESLQNEKSTAVQELSVYKESRLARKGYALSMRLKPLKEHGGKHSNKKLLKKKENYWFPIFNSDIYCKYNPDIMEVIGTDKKKLLHHFIRYGMNEGRKASETFDVYAYLKFNPDIAELYSNNKKEVYLHYLEHGINEHRRCT